MKAIEIPKALRPYFKALSMCASDDASRLALDYIHYSEEDGEFVATDGKVMLICKPGDDDISREFLAECGGSHLFEVLPPYREHNLLLEKVSGLKYPKYRRNVPDTDAPGYYDAYVDDLSVLAHGKNGNSGAVMFALGKAGVMVRTHYLLALDWLPLPSRILVPEDAAHAVRIDGKGYVFIAMPIVRIDGYDER